jgi:hypothetical protein
MKKKYILYLHAKNLFKLLYILIIFFKVKDYQNLKQWFKI